jgi:predicted O-methyltransferase YrrM
MLSASTLRTAYREAFLSERAVDYPMVDAFEERAGYAIDRARLEAAAEVLACPLKAHAPNWQHGRVLYAATRQALAMVEGPVLLVDIGTAKGFSALCLLWAMHDAGLDGQVVSIDVIDPTARITRNTVSEVAGLQTLAETLAPWPEASAIEFVQGDGADWLAHDGRRIHVAFVDGKHTEAAVSAELAALVVRQGPGDVAIFDDLQLSGVRAAVQRQRAYRVEILEVLSHRAYGVGVRC